MQLPDLLDAYETSLKSGKVQEQKYLYDLIVDEIGEVEASRQTLEIEERLMQED